MMERSWETEEVPVLEAVVRYFEEEYDDGLLYPRVADVAHDAGLDEALTIRVVRRLSPTYLQVDDETTADHPADVLVTGVTDEARRAVGQWPSAESVADGIIRELLAAADREPDESKRTKLRAAAETLGGFARDLLVNVAANVATKPIEL